MELTSWLFLLVSMVVLAVLPGPGMIAVIARSMSAGFAHGAVTTIGIVFGDYIFILLVFFGMSAMAHVLGDLYQVVSYLGGVYLCYLGLGLFRAREIETDLKAVIEPSWVANFLAGLLITLANPKAILFYAGFLPAFIDLAAATYSDLMLILLAATLAVGSSMLAYAYLAARAGQSFKGSRMAGNLNVFAGILLFATGCYLFVKA